MSFIFDQPNILKINYLLFGLHLIAGLVLVGLALFRNSKGLPFKITLGEREWNFGPKVLVYWAAAFLLITCGVHLFYALNYNNMYLSQVNRGHNMYRWVEYSITANIMAFIIAIFARITDGYLLLAIFAIVTGIMFTGMWFESVTGIMSLVPIVVGFILFAVFAFIIFMKYRDEVSKVEVNVPNWLQWVVIGTLVFYGIFGVVPILRYLGFLDDKYWYEYSYLGLSLVSKLFLGSLLGYGAFFGDAAE